LSGLYQLLRCPRCGTAPAPSLAECKGCGRSIVAAGGGLDLLDDEGRADAGRFAAQYRALRRQEGWIGADGREDPEGGEPRLWRGRLDSVSRAAAAMSSRRTGAGRAVAVDVGSGGGWAADYLRDADVIAIDLLDIDGRPGVLQVRADMRSLPLRDSTVDAAFYAASLHYASVSDAIGEAARVLRPGGLLVAVDSPMYIDRRRQAQAEARSAAYYADAGFPELAAHYHPIDVTALRAALASEGFEVSRLEAGVTARRWWERLGPPRRSSFLVARLVPTA
jgi:SAM-dependent methyltransferase